MNGQGLTVYGKLLSIPSNLATNKKNSRQMRHLLCHQHQHHNNSTSFPNFHHSIRSCIVRKINYIRIVCCIQNSISSYFFSSAHKTNSMLYCHKSLNLLSLKHNNFFSDKAIMKCFSSHHFCTYNTKFRV
jgi:hypothetical protein